MNYLLQKVTDLAKKMGYKVYKNIDAETYIFIVSNDGKVGYVQEGPGGLSYSTCHKPNRESGSGFQIERNTLEVSEEIINRTFALGPYWATSKMLQGVVKETWKQHVKRSTLEYVEV